MNPTEQVKAHKKSVITNIRVEADMGSYQYRWEDEQKFIARLRRECEEFIEHCRDHRSLNHVNLSVEHDKEDRCSVCNGGWEPVQDPELNNGALSCAGCGALIDSEKP